MKIGRNDPCRCGSGRKYKNCCARRDESAVDATTPPRAIPTRAAAPASLAPADANRLVAMAKTGRYADMETLAAALAAAHPQAGFAWKALSVALQSQGKDALQALEEAVRLLPHDAECLNNLALALRGLGRFDDAVACCRRALEIQPAVAEIWNNLGNALKDGGQFTEAMSAFRQSLELKPGFAKAHNNLGTALQELGRLDDATQSYRRAIDLDPRYAEAHNNLGAMLRLQSRPDEAEIACRRALEIEQSPAALRLLAELHADKAEFAVAEELFQRVIERDPECPEAWAGLAGLRRMTRGDTVWLSTAQRIAEQSLAVTREIPLRYALGKYFDDVGEYHQAFSNYRRANELAQRNRPPHDRRQWSTGIDRIIGAFDLPWLSRDRGGTSPSERPVLIVGMPRSGTTLAEQILASHAAVVGAGELPFWNSAAGKIGSSPAVGGDADDDILQRLAEEYLLELDRVSSGAQRVVDKMPANFLYLGLIHAALPKARILHMQRNPMDTCLSIYFQNFGAVHPYANDLEDLTHYYRDYSRLMAHWRRVLPAGAMLEVPYEALVEDTEAWSRRMIEFVGLPWDPNCLQFHRGGRSVSTFSRWQTRQRINTSSVGRWRNYEAFVEPLLALNPTARPAPAEPVRSPEVPATPLLERAKAMHVAGRLEEARRAYHEVLLEDASNFDANHHLGIIALQAGDAESAVRCLDLAVRLDPGHAQAAANLGTAYLVMNRLDEALEAYDGALRIAPRLAGGWRNRGTILQRLGRQQEAADSFQRCWELVPEFDFALGSMFEARRHACDWRDFEQNTAGILAGIAAGRNVDRPFSFLSVSDSAAEQRRCAELHAAYLCPTAPAAEWRGESYGHRRIRVAYVSADFRNHVVMNLLVPILEAHDAWRVHAIGIALTAGDDSDILRRAKLALALFIDASNWTDEQVAKEIRRLEVDIVVDLTGYTAGCRAGIFARRPAPVQVNYLGYIGTSGSRDFDYLIADRVAVPEEREKFFSERIVRMPRCFMPPGDREPIADGVPARRELGLPEAAFVLCAFNAPYKFNPTIFTVWMRLLHGIPDGVLWLRDGPSNMREHLRREAAACGVEPERLIFAGRVPAMRDHLARHARADLFLDTFPFGAHATARDALWAGLPVLTCAGESFASRVAGSMLTTLNLRELVTESLADYESRALELAGDREWLSQLRARLADNLRNGPLFDAPSYCRHLESAYARMREHARRGAEPASFDASPGGHDVHL